MEINPFAGFGRLESLIEALLLRFPNGSLNVFDRELRYELVGGEGLEEVGLTPSYLQGRTLSELFSAEHVALVEPFFRRSFTGERVRFNVSLFGHDYHISAGPLRYERGDVASIIVVALDITDQRIIQRLSLK